MNIFKSKWSKWHDLSCGQLSSQHYLLQARRHENGKLQFRVAVSKSAHYTTSPTLEKLETVK